MDFGTVLLAGSTLELHPQLSVPSQQHTVKTRSLDKVIAQATAKLVRLFTSQPFPYPTSEDHKDVLTLPDEAHTSCCRISRLHP